MLFRSNMLCDFTCTPCNSEGSLVIDQAVQICQFLLVVHNSRIYYGYQYLRLTSTEPTAVSLADWYVLNNNGLKSSHIVLNFQASKGLSGYVTVQSLAQTQDLFLYQLNVSCKIYNIEYEEQPDNYNKHDLTP